VCPFVPVRYMLKTYLWFFVLTGFFSVSVSAVCRGEAVPEVVWQCLESRHTLIRYQSERDLRKFNGRIQFRAERFIFSRLFSPLGAKDLAATVTTKVDALFERAQQILDMRRKIKKVTINVYHDKKQLYEAYLGIYMRPCHVRAWYEYRFNTVYICINDMNEGMLAHEMAHAIIDHYLVVRPPPATAEILARYVDSHLKR